MDGGRELGKVERRAPASGPIAGASPLMTFPPALAALWGGVSPHSR